MRCLQRIEQGEANGIIAWHPDRLGRNSVDGGRIIYLIDTGKLKSLKFPTFWFDNTPQGKFMLNIAFGQSKYYIDNLSENIKKGIRQKLRRGEWPGWAPLGYLNDYKNHTVILDPEKYRAIRKVFELYATGNYALSDLADFFNKKGITGRTGKKIYRAGIERILRNPFYCGMMKFNNELHEGKHPAIVSKETFDKVQKVLEEKSRRKKVKHYFVFRGYMNCGECGASITASIQKGHNYYHCTKRKRKCSQPYIREENLTEDISRKLTDVAIDLPTYNFLSAEIESQRKKLESYTTQKKAKLKSELNKTEETINKLLDVYLEGAIEKAEYQQKKEELLTQKNHIKAKLSKLTNDPGFRFELAKNLFFRCNSVNKIISEKDLPAISNFLKKSGLNHNIKDKKLNFDWARPYFFVANGNRKIKNIVKKYRREFNNSDLCPGWRGITNNVRAGYVNKMIGKQATCE